MANKSRPTDAELRELLVTPKDKLPKDPLKCKRVKFAEEEFLRFAKVLRDFLEEGVAKVAAISQLDATRKLINKAICHPDKDPAALVVKGKLSKKEEEALKKAEAYDPPMIASPGFPVPPPQVLPNEPSTVAEGPGVGETNPQAGATDSPPATA